MYQKFSARAVPLLLFFVFLIIGCGNDQESFVVNGAVAPSRPVFGKVSVGDPAFATVARAVGLDHTTLATSPVDKAGNFRFDGAQLPPNFRVVVSTEESQIALAADVREFSPQSGRFIWVNIPTSLVSAYLEAHPGESFASAESKARSVLGLPAHVELGAGVQESGRSPFAHLAFLADADGVGGVEALIQQLVLEMDQPNQSESSGPRFRLSRSDLTASTSNLEPEARALALFLQSNQTLELSVVGDAITDSVKFVGQGVAGSILNSGTASSWTWLSSQLGVSYGTTNQLNEIEGQLDDLATEIAAFETSVESSDYQNAAADVNTNAIVPLQTLEQNLTAASANFEPDVFTPINGESQSVSTLLTSLGQFDAESALLIIQNYMLGTAGQTNMNTLALDLNVTQVLGVDAPPQFARMPWRKNSWLDVALMNQNFYTGIQNLAANWLAESAHQNLNLASGINGVIPTLDSAAASIKQQRGQFPYYMPHDNLIVDLEFGVMWYAEMQTERTYDDAVNYAANFSIQGNNYSTPVTYSDWRLPTESEIISLQERGRLYAGGYDPTVGANSDNGYGDYGMSAAGLPGMGFTNLSSGGVSNINDNGDVWFQFYALEDDNWKAEDFYEFQLNVEDSTSQKSSSDERPFFMCRSITKPLLPVGLVLDPSEIPAPPFTTRQPEPIEFLGLGVLQDITLSFQDIDTDSEITGVKAAPTASFRIWQGGPFTRGNFDDSSDNLSSSVPEEFVDTLISSLPEICGFTSSTTDLRVSNWPGEEGLLIYGVDQFESVSGNVTAVATGYDASTNNFPVALTTSGFPSESVADRQPLQIQVSPRNRLYDYPNGTTQNENYYAAEFFENFTVEDVTDDVTWTLLQYDPNTGETTPLPNNYQGAMISNQESGLLQLDKTTNTIEFFQIRATLSTSEGSFSNSVNLQVITD